MLDKGLLLRKRVGQRHPTAEVLEMCELGAAAHEKGRDLLSPSSDARLESTAFGFLVGSSSSIPISGF